MSIILTDDRSFGGTRYAAGSTISLDGALEANLVAQGLARWAGEAPYQGGATYPASFAVNAAGKITGLVGRDDLVVDVSHRLNHATQLKKWRKALAAVQSGAANAKLMFLGDSTTAGAMATGVSWANNRPLTIANAIARRLSGAGVNANVGSTLGPGVINTANFLLYDTRWTLGAEWVANSLPGLGGGYIVSLTTGATAANFTPTAPDGTALSFDRIEIVYLKNSAYANFTVGVDGGAAAFTSTQAGGGAIDRVTVSVAAGTHTVNIQKVGGDSAKHLHVQSVICYSSTAPAVLCLTAGYGGGLAANMADAAAYYTAKNALIYQAPDLTVINLTINDAIAQTSVSAYTASLQAIITAAKLSGDVILMGGNAIQDTFSGFVAGTDAAYYQAVESLATLNDVPYLNAADVLGDYTAANAAGFMGDGAHPNRYGYQEMANALYPYLML